MPKFTYPHTHSIEQTDDFHGYSVPAEGETCQQPHYNQQLVH